MVTAEQAQDALEGKTWEQVATYINDNAVAFHLKKQLDDQNSKVTPPSEKPAYQGMGSGNAAPAGRRQPPRV
jgi:hypothetical protein